MGKSPRPLPAHMEGELDDARAIVMALAAPLWTGARALAASAERAALRSAMPAAALAFMLRFTVRHGLTLLHFPAQRKHFLWVTLGGFSSV